jgi:hypothetical protein
LNIFPYTNALLFLPPQELIAIIDEDGSGEIDFDEFVDFIIMLKQGDSRLAGFGQMLENLKNTPLGSLEQQCNSRGLSFKFATLEIREATMSQPPCFVVELAMSGSWIQMEQGRAVSVEETRRVQGLGKNIRVAKNSAASAALVKLADYMPGLKFGKGIIPDDWLAWMDENLMRGVECRTILDILVSKGFYPHHNIAVMQKIGAWLAFNRFCEKYGDFQLDDRYINAELDEWILKVLERGLDGYTLFEVLSMRGMPLAEYHPLYAQKLKHNEMGTLVDNNGRTPKLLDFWQACRDGDHDLVDMYCSCGQDPDEEQIGRNDSETRTPLMLASMGNHVECVKLLVAANASVNKQDRRGRTALHYAANHNSLECCNYLMESGAQLFHPDFSKNTAIHLAAMANKARTVDYLATKGQDFCRSITSDRVRPCKNKTFAELCDEVWEDLQTLKLTKWDVRRFEKTWLGDASVLFCSRMDADVKHMVCSSTNKDIIHDILSRFDPRPETGIMIQEGKARDNVWHPTIPRGHELGVLLNYLFRQTATDNTNSWQRTPLHVAADQNQLDSHYETIKMLIDKQGCNVWLRDIHGKRAIDLLMMQRNYGPKTPSSTREKEEMIFEFREERLETLKKKFDGQEMEAALKEKYEVILEARSKVENMTDSVWNAVRDASIRRQNFGQWSEYLDPDTGNMFFCRRPLNPLRSKDSTHFTHFQPHEMAQVLISRSKALQFHMSVRSVFLRSHKDGRIRVYRCKYTEADYWYDKMTDDVSFEPPKFINWKDTYRSSELVRKLGFVEEWEERRDADGNIFYRNNTTLTQYFTYVQPVNALVVKAKDKHCTKMKHKENMFLQKFYSCEECNRKYVNSLGKMGQVIRICEPCAMRCHKGHRGLSEGGTTTTPEVNFVCLCDMVSSYSGGKCCARQISQGQVYTYIYIYIYIYYFFRIITRVFLTLCPI